MAQVGLFARMKQSPKTVDQHDPFQIKHSYKPKTIYRAPFCPTVMFPSSFLSKHHFETYN